MPVSLARPSLALWPSYAGFLDEMRAHGDTVWPSRAPVDGQGPAEFVAGLLAKEHAATPPAVPETVHWGVLDDQVVGVIALRHELTEQLAQFGGHVGYEVRPSARRAGVATAMLRLLLATDRARRIGRLLVTCAPTNEGSRRAIEANGGVLTDVRFVEAVQRETCRYLVVAR